MQTHPPFRLSRMFRTSLGLPIGLILASAALADGTPKTGEAIYKQMCSSCHGASGEGSKAYQRPLIGDRSPAQLTRLIERTMPEDDPGTCVGDDARLVASYLHDAFYSKIAQARNKPPRVELARLTVRQYRNALADLVGSFRDPASWDGKEQGLKGEYFKSGRFQRNDRVIERIDPVVRFDFGLAAPGPDKFDPKEFAIHWHGSVLAPETGEYEFVVRTENSIKFFLNDAARPFIDAWVKSGKDTEFRGSAFLLAGHAYPIRLEYMKAKQGVEDSKETKAKAPPQKGSVSLEWKLPHRPGEVIPARFLSPNQLPESFAPSTPFPPDDRSIGYERGSSISKEWDLATTEAALEVADYVEAHLKELAGLVGNGAGPERYRKLRDFCLKFAERAFRRPLGTWQVAKYVDRQFARASGPEEAVKRSILLVLKSPLFLYREVDGLDGYGVASRLAFGLWDSPPDRALLKTVALGRLTDRAAVVSEANRMVDDPRTKAKVRQFFHQWLRIDQVPDLAKEPSLYPGFDAEIASDLRTSLDLFLDDVVWGDSPDFRQLLLADSVYLNGRLATLYGAELPPDAPFTKESLDPKERAGLLTHPYLLANFAYTATSSPIHRGVFIARSVLGRGLRPPPVAVAPLAPDLHAGMTTRERVTLQTSPASCVTCHAMINGLGFGLERFDAIGRLRSEEKGKPVDASGVYEPPSGDLVRYEGARQLAETIAASEETHAAFVEQLFHHMIQQPIRAFGPGLSEQLRRSFADNGFNIRSLLVEIVAASATPPPRRDLDSKFPSQPFATEP